MLSITKVNNTVQVDGLDNKLYPDNGRLAVPLNSILLVLDDSDIVTFRSASNNNVYFSAHISQIRISGATVTKQTIISAFDAVANASSGGGGGGGTQVQSNWNETNTSSPAYIQNKPTRVSQFINDAGYLTTVNEKFPNSWTTNDDMAALINDINNDTSARPGDVYLDTVELSDLPEGIMQGEMKVEIMSELDGIGKVIVFTMTSSNVAPYHWEYTSAYGSTGTWRGWVTDSQLQSEATARQNADNALDTKIDTTNSSAIKATVSGTTLNLNTIA